MGFLFRAVAATPLGLLLIAVAVSYALVGREVARRQRTVASVALWLSSTVALGLLLTVHACSQPFICDAGGAEVFWGVMFPRVLLVAAIALGLATIVLRARRAGRPPRSLRREAFYVVVAVFVGVVIAKGVLAGADRVLCGRVHWRRSDGTWTTKCEYYQTHQ